MTDTVALNKLALSPRNVRKTNGEEDIAGLAESIKSKGLLQNLVVSRSPDGKTYEVDAGGRRLRALQLLAARKDLAKNFPVPVIVIAPDAATEASLAENLQKIAMNPADEVEAFATIVAGYEANGMASAAERIANCARRFGVSERTVAQRLALAELTPAILDALREARITVAAANAYAAHPDPAEQLKVFTAHEKRSGTYGKHDPREIRDALKGRIYTTDDRLVRYIGLDAYRAAGGTIAVDLFFDEGERDILLNPGLVDKLAAEKGGDEAQALAQAAGWLDGVLAPVHSSTWQSPPAPKGFTARWASAVNETPPEVRSSAMAAYRVGQDGKLEQLANYILAPVAPVGDDQAKVSLAERQALWTAEQRQEAIGLRAARLAVRVGGTTFEGRAFWPSNDRWVDAIDEQEDGSVIVAMLVKVSADDIAAHRAEAERLHDLAEAKEAEAAEGDTEDADELETELVQ